MSLEKTLKAGSIMGVSAPCTVTNPEMEQLAARLATKRIIIYSVWNAYLFVARSGWLGKVIFRKKK